MKMPLVYSILWFIRKIGVNGIDYRIPTNYDAIQKITIYLRILSIRFWNFFMCIILIATSSAQKSYERKGNFFQVFLTQSYDRSLKE
jgi:hypothetical protein